MTKGFVVCRAHIGLTKLNINLRIKKEPRLLCVMLLADWYPIPTGFLINVEWPIGNDAEDKRGCQGVQIIIGKPVNGHLGGPTNKAYCKFGP